jgi:hypothetical protein
MAQQPPELNVALLDPPDTKWIDEAEEIIKEKIHPLAKISCSDLPRKLFPRLSKFFCLG